MKKLTSFLTIAVVIMLANGCAMTNVTKDFGGTGVYDAKSAVQLHHTNIAIHLLFAKPLVGDATLSTNVKELGAAAKANGASSMRTFKLDSASYWWVFFPFTVVLTPVVTQSAADAIIQ